MFSALPETEAAAAKFAASEGVDLETAGILENFRFKVGDFMAAVNDLAGRSGDAAKSPALKREYDALMSRAGIIKGTVETVTGTIDKALAYFRAATGMDGLGVIPLLPVAVIATATAAIGKWIADAYVMRQKLNEVRRLEAQGLSPQQAAATVAKLTPGFFTVGGLLPLALLGGMLLLWWRGRRG